MNKNMYLQESCAIAIITTRCALSNVYITRKNQSNLGRAVSPPLTQTIPWLQTYNGNFQTFPLRKLPLPLRRSPPTSNMPTHTLTPTTTPNHVPIHPAVSPGCRMQTNRQTNRQTAVRCGALHKRCGRLVDHRCFTMSACACPPKWKY